MTPFKKFFIFLLFSAAAFGQSTVAVTANVKTIFGTNSATRVKVCFTLLTSDGQQPADPHVVGSGVLVPTQTQCLSPDANGLISTNLIPNDIITVAGALNTTNYSTVWLYNGSPAHGALYNFLLADVTEDLNSKSPVNLSVSPSVTPTDSIYARLDGGNQPFLGAIRSCVQNGMYVAGSACYPTVHQAIAVACAASPVGGTIWLPPGTYVENSSLSVANATWCNSITLSAAGSGQCDSVTPPVTITTTLTSGHLIDGLDANDWSVSNLCLKNTGAGSTGAAINFASSQRATVNNVYISGPFGQGLRFFSSSSASASTIWNNVNNVHCTGLAANGTGVLMNSSNASTKVINGNNLLQDHCTGGTGGKALWLTNSGVHNQVINDNVIECTECSATSGTGVQIDNGSTSRLTLLAPNIEGSTTGFVKQTANTVLIVNGFIGSNGNNSLGENVQDSQPAFTSFLNTSIGGVIQQFAVDPAGGMIVNCVAFPGSNCNGLTNLMNGISGWGFGVSGSQKWQVLTGAFVPVTAGSQDLGNTTFPVGNMWLGNVGTNNIKLTGTATGARVQTLQDASGTVPVTIASGTSTLANGAITQQTCATVVTTAATGALTTDTVSWSFASAPTTADGSLNYTWYLTAGNVNWKVCNTSAGGLTPSGLVINWRIIR